MHVNIYMNMCEYIFVYVWMCVYVCDTMSLIMVTFLFANHGYLQECGEGLLIGSRTTHKWLHHWRNGPPMLSFVP